MSGTAWAVPLAVAAAAVAGAAAWIAYAPAAPDPVEDTYRTLALAWVRRDQAPAPVRPVAAWRAGDGLLCGEIEAPAALRPRRATIRYVFDASTGLRQVEYHEGWTGGGALPQAILDANRAAFDGLWRDHCAPAAPLGRRLAAWFN